MPSPFSRHRCLNANARTRSERRQNSTVKKKCQQISSLNECEYFDDTMVKTKQERLAQQRLCKRRKYAEIKSDPELYELEKEKQRAKYEKRKKEKKQKSIAEKSPREQQQIRKRWKENSKKYRLNKKDEKSVIPSIVHVDASEGFSEQTNHPDEDPICLFSKKDLLKAERKIRYREIKKRVRLTGIIKNLQKITQKQKMTIIRLKSIINKQSNQTESPTDIPDVTNSSPNQKKKRTLTHLRHTSNLRSRKDTKFSLLRQKVIDDIVKFYNDDAVSTICAGKKEFITRNKIRMQKRYLTAPLKVLHKKILAETHIKVSYSFFTKHRPFWVLHPKPTNRETCLCVQHTNIDLLIKALNNASIVAEKTSDQVVSNLCCDRRNTKCLLRQCIYCNDKTLNYKEFSNDENFTYFQWKKKTKEMVTKTGLTKKQILTVKDKITTQPLTAIRELDKLLSPFFLHIHNIESQYTTMKYLKENLVVSEAVIHVDFSENYALKYAEEVQSFHFGGSRQQVSLHTSVIYSHDFSAGTIRPTSVCTISTCVRHDAAAIWAHLIPLIKQALQNNPFITSLHFLSDSPVSQYRNKYIFYMITQIKNDFEQIKRITWNYSEAGHGKGAPDGVGAVLKRTADSMVQFGRDVGDFNSFIDVLKENVNNIIIEVVKEESIKEKEKLFPKCLKAFRGTLSIHQVIWDVFSKKLVLRNLSCFLCDVDEICIHGKHLGFYEITETTPKQIKKKHVNVVLLADTAPHKSMNRNKEIKILSDITFKNNENIENYLSRPSTSKSSFIP